MRIFVSLLTFFTSLYRSLVRGGRAVLQWFNVCVVCVCVCVCLCLCLCVCVCVFSAGTIAALYSCFFVVLQWLHFVYTFVYTKCVYILHIFCVYTCIHIHILYTYIYTKCILCIHIFLCIHKNMSVGGH